MSSAASVAKKARPDLTLTEADIEAIADRVHQKIKEDPPTLMNIMGDVSRAAQAVGRWRTAERYISMKCLPGAQIASSRVNLLERSVRQIEPKGMLMEFGVAGGETIKALADQTPQRKWYGFDSFEGLPEPWHTHAKGAYSLKGVLPKVNKNVELIVGLFCDTLPNFVERHRKELERDGIAMLHVDCDLYSSAKYVLDTLKPYLHVGTVIQFDEYWNFHNWTNDEAKAFDEFLETANLGFRVLGYTRQRREDPEDQQLAVILTEKQE